jgi:ribosomal protein S18 acetylase RimI-like enzyme
MLTLTLTPYVPEDRRQVIYLLGQAHYRHFHLDWQRPVEWLAERNICCWVARHDEDVTALIGASIEEDGAAWLRLVAVERDDDGRLLGELWARLNADLRAHGVRQMAVLLQEYWLRPDLLQWGFENTNAVVTLRRTNGPAPPYPFPPLTIREATPQDLPAIARVDASAFEPLWRYDERTLWLASHAAATFTVLNLNGTIIGYQLSTHHGTAGHLARLAIDPVYQGMGYGGFLVGEMLRFFARRDITCASVNTQQDNLHSQRLYTRLGFQFTGHRAPVWMIDL